MAEQYRTPKNTQTTHYTPSCRRGMGVRVWRDMFSELICSRELTGRLYLRDFSARYRQSILGYIWAVVPALVTAATFSWLNRSKVLPINGTHLPYPVFVLLGTTIWQLFASGLGYTTQSLVAAGNLITKINFPRETLVVAAFGQSAFEFVIRALLTAIAFAAYHVSPAWTAVLIPIAVLPLCLLTMALGFISSLVNCVTRDAGQMVTFVLTFWMFLTPVVYPAPHRGPHALINILNPVSPFVNAAQDLAAVGHLTQPGFYAAGCCFSVIIFALAWRIFHLTETRIAERV